jgi:hypothetical protein
LYDDFLEAIVPTISGGSMRMKKIGIIGLGMALTLGGLAERLSRKSPA